MSSNTGFYIVWKRRKPKAIFVRGIGRATLPETKWRNQIQPQPIVRRKPEVFMTIFETINPELKEISSNGKWITDNG